MKGESKKTAASVGMFKTILCFNAAGIRQEPRDASRLSARRSGGSSPDRFSYLEHRCAGQRLKSERDSEMENK